MRSAKKEGLLPLVSILCVCDDADAGAAAADLSQIDEADASGPIGVVSLLLCCFSILLLILLDVTSAASSALISRSRSKSPVSAGSLTTVQQSGVKVVENYHTSLF